MRGTKHKVDWKPTTLQVCIDARNLCTHTRLIMANPKVFNPANDWNCSTMSEINRCVIRLYLLIFGANRINLDKEPWRKNDRLGKQEQALALCNDLYGMLEMAKSQFHLPLRKFWNWVGMLYNVDQKLSAWHLKDVERYSGI